MRNRPADRKSTRFGADPEFPELLGILTASHARRRGKFSTRSSSTYPARISVESTGVSSWSPPEFGQQPMNHAPRLVVSPLHELLFTLNHFSGKSTSFPLVRPAQIPNNSQRRQYAKKIIGYID